MTYTKVSSAAKSTPIRWSSRFCYTCIKLCNITIDISLHGVGQSFLADRWTKKQQHIWKKWSERQKRKSKITHSSKSFTNFISIRTGIIAITCGESSSRDIGGSWLKPRTLKRTILLWSLLMAKVLKVSEENFKLKASLNKNLLKTSK